MLIAAACEATPNDYTGDHKADLVYQSYPSHDWVQVGQTTPLAPGSVFTSLPVGPFGVPSPEPASGDYNGDLKWEPAEVSGTTWMSSAWATPVVYQPAGMPMGTPAAPGPHHIAPQTLIPVPGDYDGAGKTVPAYYDQVDATWWIMGHATSTQFGIPPSSGGTEGYDMPSPADYDGDGHTDIAVYRPTDSTFHYLSSKSGREVVIQEGQPGDMPVPGDYDGVGHAEAAVATSDFATWYVAGRSDPIATFAPRPGSTTVLPTQGDYDGDGKTDPAIFDKGSDTQWDVAGQGTVATLPSTATDVEVAPWLIESIVHILSFVCELQPQCS